MFQDFFMDSADSDYVLAFNFRTAIDKSSSSSF